MNETLYDALQRAIAALQEAERLLAHDEDARVTVGGIIFEIEELTDLLEGRA